MKTIVRNTIHSFITGKFLLGKFLQKSYLLFIAFAFLLSVKTEGQAVVISEVSNQLATADEWVELLVIDDNVDMRNWTINDYSGGGTARRAVIFKNIPFWEHMRAGTIIILKSRNNGNLPPIGPCNSMTEDVNKDDGYIQVGLDNSGLFESAATGAGADDLNDCFGSNMMSFVNYGSGNPGDIVQLFNSSGVHVHAFGFRGEDVAWSGIPRPKFRTDNVVGISNGNTGGITNVNVLANYDTITTYTTMLGNVGTMGYGQESVTRDFWRVTRDPIMTSQTITPVIAGATVQLTWLPCVDPYPADQTTGYIIFRRVNTDFPFTFEPKDGTTYSNGQVLPGGEVVMAHVQHSGAFLPPSFSYTDNTVACGITYYYRVYAYRYGTDDLLGNTPPLFNGNEVLERGRSYNEYNYVKTDAPVALPVPTAFNVSGGGSFCTGGSGVLVSLSGSQVGVNYQLILDGTTNVGGPVAGTGGAINFPLQTAPGTYTVVGTFSASGCSAPMNGSAVITVTSAPNATISYTTPICNTPGTISVTQTGTIGGSYTSTPGLAVNSTTGDINTGTSVPGSYTVTYTIAAAGGCPAFTTTAPIVITAAPSATISYAGTPFCSNASPANVSLTGTTGGSYSASPAGLTINSSNGQINPATSSAGTYTVTYTIAAAGGCPLFTTTTSVTITAQPAATIGYSGSSYCQSAGVINVTQTGTAGGTYSATPGGLTINAGNGAITTTTSTPGTYLVTYTIPAGGGCAAVPTTTNVTITPVPSATINYAGSPYCSDAGTATVTQTGTTGGTYSAPAGLSINPATGAINLAASTPGTYTVTYTIAAAGGCPAVPTTASVTITAAPNATTISYNGSPYCSNSGSATVTLTGTAGGTYSAPGGLSIDPSTGAINPGSSTPGTYTVTYTIPAAGGCAGASTSTSVTITAAPAATISYPGSPYCTSSGSAPVTITGTTGGTFSAPAAVLINPVTGEINPSASTPGTYTISYTIAAAGGCAAVTATTSITINALPAATISYPGSPYCADAGTATVSLTGTAGGTYSAPGGLSINPSTGDINTVASTPGTYTVTYTIAAASGCPAVTTTTSVTINAAPFATISYTGSPYCSNTASGTVTLTGTTGGTFSAPGGLSINPSTGEINPSTSTPGTYTVTYTLAAAGGCAAVTVTTSVTIASIPVASISYTGSPYCSNSASAPPTITGQTGGIFSATPPGLSINPSTGEINIGASAAGTYTINYTIAAAGGCPAVTASASITINAVPAAPIPGTPLQPSCSNPTGSVDLSGLPSGSWTINPGGITGSGTTTTISGLPQGSYTYTVTNAAGCVSPPSTTIIINAAPLIPDPPVIGTVTQPTCTVATGTVNLSGLPSGNWTLNPGTISGAGTATIISGLTPGTYSFTVTNSDGCTSGPSVQVTIDPAPLPPATPVVTVVQPNCIEASGIIQITSAISGLSFSLDGGPYGPYPAGGYIVATGPHTISAQNTSGCVSPEISVTIDPQPPTPLAPSFAVIQPTCTVATATITITSATAGLSFSLDGGPYLPYPAGGYIVSPGPHTLTAQNTSGCISPVSPVTVNNQPLTPAAPVPGIITQPTCAIATGSIELTGLPAGNWTINPGSISGTGNTTTLTGLPQGTYTYTVTNEDGCISVLSTAVIINAAPVTPSAPVVGPVTQPNCTTATGSVILNNLPAGNWTLNPGGITGNTGSTTITGLTQGTYNYTVTNAAGCTSAASANIVINAAPLIPPAPLVGPVTHPNCTTAMGSVELTNLPAGNWTLNPGGITGNTSSTTITGLTPGTYNYTVTNAAGCTSAASANIVINAAPVTPPAPVVGPLTQPNCTTATGSVVLNNLPAGNWTLHPGGITGNTSSTTITGLTPGTYNYTVTNAAGCTSAASANIVINAAPVTPPAPVLGPITQPNCTTATGSVVLNNLPAGNWTLNPGGITGNTSSTTITGLTPGTYNYTVTNAAGCTSAASANIVINAAPVTPPAPVVGPITQPTCSTATGSVVLNNLPAGNWTLNPGSITGNTSSTTITGLTPGTYNYTVTNAAGCTSVASAAVVINPQPATPAAPGIGTLTHPTCAVATGTVQLTGLPSGNWTINPGNIGGTGSTLTIPNLAPGTYNFTVTSAAGCTSTATAVTVNAQPATPAVPQLQVDCSMGAGNGAITIIAPVGAGLEYSLDGGAFTSATTFTGVANGSHTVTVRNTAGCSSSNTTNVSCGCASAPAITLSSSSGSTCGVTPVTVSGNTFTNAGQVTITENGAGTISTASVSTSPFSFTYTPAAADAGTTVTITLVSDNPLGAPCAAVTVTYTLNVNANPVVTAGSNSPVCAGATLNLNATPPAASSYSWTGPNTFSSASQNPFISNVTAAASGTYNVTVTDANGCSGTASTVVTVTSTITPSFTQLGPFCQNATAPALPGTSTNSISGTWNPATINTASIGTTTYTFTPAAGCATQTTMDIVVTGTIIPLFAPIGPLCQGSVAPSLPTISDNGVTGTWSPATINTAIPGTSTLTFTPTGGCAVPVTINVLITGTITPTFTQIAPICQGSAAPTLPGTSDNGVSGTWSPATIDTGIPGTSTLTFTPAGSCAVPVTMDVFVTPLVTPTFATVPAVCAGTTLAPLPSTSLNGIPGTWSPALNNTTTTTYTFTPANSQCATTATLTITINPLPATPVAGTITHPTCTLATGSVVLNNLPAGNWTLNPGAISGTGSSNTISGLAAGIYNYTVTNAGGCTSAVSADIIINPQPSIPPAPVTSVDCSGGSGNAIVTVTSPAGLEYSLDGGAFSTNTIFTGVANGSHTITVRNAAGCTNTGAPFTVACGCPNPPTLTLTANTGSTCGLQPVTISGNTFSNAGTITITENGAGTVSPSSVTTSPFSFTYTPVAADAGNTVTITVSTDNPSGPPCAAATATYTLNVRALPAVTAGSNAPVCTGASLNLTSTSATAYSWNGPNSFTSIAQNPVITGATAAATGTYTVTVTDANGCTNTASTSVTVNPNTTPVFTPIGPLCLNATAPSLPSTSTNGVNGTWSPATVNTGTPGTSTYTFTPSGGCAVPVTMDIVITNSITPSFTQIGPLCQNSTPPALPSASNNGVSGSWNAATINTSAPGLTTYTFTPSGGCAVPVTMDIVVAPSITPAFAAIGPLCQGAAAPALPLTSTNGINGTWNPATISTATPGTTTYTFTPTAPCAAPVTMDIVVNATVTPVFTQIGPLCQGTTAPGLPASSTNGVNGSWSPATVNTGTPGTSTYTFTASGGCAAPVTMTIVVNPAVTAVFNPIGPLCQGSAAPGLPASSTNGINGTWNPATISTATAGATTYTFTPSVACAAPVTMNIVVTTQTVPVFTSIGPLCQGSTAPGLPATSTNGVSGSWSPATISTATAGTTTYTFTPTGTCAATATMDIVVAAAIPPAFNTIGPLCQNTAAPALPASSTNGVTGTWSPASISTANAGTTIYTFTPAANQCAAVATMSITVITPTAPLRYNTVSAQANIPLQLTARAIGINYQWSPGTGLSSTTISNPVFTHNQQTEYTIAITNAAGCRTVDTQLVRIAPPPPRYGDIQVPRAFSPNGDGHNDKLFPFLINIRQLNFFRVFNRWGQLVYETNVTGQGWDGIFKGQVQGADTFRWMAEGVSTDGTLVRKTGSVVLIR